MKTPQELNSNSHEKQSGGPAVEGFAAQYGKDYPRLTAIAAAVLGRQEGAEDIVQQAAGIAVAKGKRFANAAAFTAWMAGVVRRCALNQRRKIQRRRTYATDPADILTLADSADQDPLPIDPATGDLLPGQVSFEDHVLRALAGLSAEARCCLLLRTVQQLSYAEISQLLNIPPGTAMSHVHRSRRMLRHRLADMDDAAEKKPNAELCQEDEQR